MMDLLSVKESHARTLLIHHRWDVDNLFAVYGEKGTNILFAEAGVSVEERCDSESSVPSSIMCEICIEDVPGDEATRMDCGHCFCNNCVYLFHLLFLAYSSLIFFFLVVNL